MFNLGIFKEFNPEKNWGDDNTVVLSPQYLTLKRKLNLKKKITLKKKEKEDEIETFVNVSYSKKQKKKEKNCKTNRYHAKVMSWDSQKGYGFLTDVKGNNSDIKDNIFVHQSKILKEGLRFLSKNKKVTFDLIYNEDHKSFQAENVIEC